MRMNMRMISKNNIIFYCCVVLFILLILFTFYPKKGICKYILKEKYENISGSTPPTYIFIYGKNSEELKKLFKDEYKENTMNIKVLEKDIKQLDKDYLTKNKINKNIDYEVRYYPQNGYCENMNCKNNDYELYYGKISDLKDIIIQKENEYEDSISEEDDSGADSEFKTMMNNS